MSLRNKTNNELEQEISALSSKIERINRQAAAEYRALSPAEKSWISDANSLKDDLTHELKSRPISGPLTLGDGGFTNSNYRPFRSLGEQLMAVKNAGVPGGRVDERLYSVNNSATGLGETTPSEGGFLIQPSLSSEIISNVFSEGKIASLCRRITVAANSNGIKIPGVDETSRADGSRAGGVQAYWLGEGAAIPATKPKFRQIELDLKKLAALVYCTDELLMDAPALSQFIASVASKEISFQIDDAIIHGTGAGMPLGIMNSDALVTVEIETGQLKNTLMPENIFKMYARTLGASSNYVWLVSKTVLPQLYGMSLEVGTGGAPVFLAGGSVSGTPENRLLGLPIIITEQCPSLGTAGDIILANFKDGYYLAEKGGIQADMSIHVRFIYDESVFRFVFRIDGQPTLADSITPFKGSDTQSHFITLGERTEE